MFAHLRKRDNEQRKFFADLFGAELSTGGAQAKPKEIVYNGDPESVKHLSQEEKEVMTQQLMAQHKAKFNEFNVSQNG